VPYVGRSRAVVMRTKDGGLSWDSVEGLVIPRINRLRFSDPINGWAIGETGNLFQTGIYSTSDGGQTWSSQTAEKLEGWIDGDRTPSAFVTVDYAGRPGVITANNFEAAVVLGGSRASISRLKMADSTTGWAVGRHGALLETTNGGLSWSPTATPQISELLPLVDLTTLSITDEKIWFAGDPGTFLFSVDRKTGAASASRTPITTRINRLCFLDGKNGWAVGALGTIIATRDGGETWQLQRGEHRRIAMLGVAPNLESLPLELFSKYASEENRICASLLLDGSIKNRQTAVQATERLGCAATILMEHGQDAESSRQSVLENMVRVLRTWQPNVIVCNSGHALLPVGGGDSLDPVSLVEDAIRMAADQTAFSDQINHAGLKVWRVERLAILDPAGLVGIDPQRLLPRSGVLIEDQISVSRVLAGQSILVDQGPNYQVSHYTNVDRMNAGDLLSGLGTGVKVPSRRDDDSRRGNLVMIQQASAKQKKFKQFVQFEANSPQDLLVWRQQIESFALTMESDVAGVWLMQLAERYLANGKTELAAHAVQSIATRWPDHAFAPAALTWLSQYYASDEFGQIEFMTRVRAGQLDRQGAVSNAQRIENRFQTTPQSVQQVGGGQLVWVPTQRLESQAATPDRSDIVQAGNEEAIPESRPAFFDERLKLASYYLSQLGQRDPELVAGPQYQFLESQISRRINGTILSEGRLRNLAQQRDSRNLGISVGAHRELGLHDLLPNNSNPIPVMVCQATDARPRLDGKLNEAFWRSAMENGNCIRSNVALPCLDSNSKTDIAVFAYDHEFLYAGFICKKVQGHYYNAKKLARPRDPDLDRRDRIELAIDLDRDYRSVDRFVVDHRGWVRESCGGSIGWNPDWYVSQSEDETTWTVEFAIPLEQIAPGQIEPGTTWAFQVARRAFDLSNIWEEPMIVPTAVNGQQKPGGLQTGFESLPAQFRLIRFETLADVPKTR
jgi:photosystem II stability/assembly factor-like uncharacterized protein